MRRTRVNLFAVALGPAAALVGTGLAAAPTHVPPERPDPIGASSSRPPARPEPEPSYRIAEVRPGRQVPLRTAPGRDVVTRVGSRTEFGSRQTLAVAARRGRWLGVKTSELPNGDLGWVPERTDGLDSRRTRLSLRVDVSRRRLELRDGSDVVKRTRVGIGAPGSPTPSGRFAVTDKLPGSRYSSEYGCCILALSGHQPRPPAGWQGGTRVAIHGTDSPGSVGQRSTAGCVSAPESALKPLMRRVPLGTPVFIRK
jgi:L,D-transpeptidase catalytic domain